MSPPKAWHNLQGDRHPRLLCILGSFLIRLIEEEGRDEDEVIAEDIE
jgi:hypothetical protein